MWAPTVAILLLFWSSFELTHATQSAKFVLGTGMYKPRGVAVDPTTDKIFVADTENNRIFIFNPDRSLFSVIGQPNNTAIMANINGTVGQEGLSKPQGMFVDAQGTLWVADSGNNRVVWYLNATKDVAPGSADGVLGQASFFDNSPKVGASFMNDPKSVRIYDDTLWVVDSVNHRILGFSPVPTTNSQAANLLVGHTTFNSAQHLLASSSTLNYPTDMWALAAGLMVADTDNNRVLFFPSPAQAPPGAPAQYVYGQENFTTNTSGTSQSKFTRPSGFAIGYEGTIFISDKFNHRILIFSPPTSLGNLLPAIDVLGQPDFASGVSGNGLDQLSFPARITYDDKQNALWVADENNNRIVMYANILPKPSPIPTLTTDLTFLGRTPAAVLTPKDEANRQSRVLIFPSLIEEMDPQGNVAVSLPSPRYGYTFTQRSDAQQTQYFKFDLDLPQGEVVVEYSFFAVQVPLNSAGISFIVEPSTLKLTITIQRWNFSSPSNTLRLHLDLNVAPLVTSITKANNNNTNNIITFILESSPILTTTINLLPSGIADKTTVLPVKISLTNSSSSTNTSLDLMLDLPSFNNSFTYDPDFSVTVAPTDEGGGGGDNLELLALLTILAIPCVFIFVTMVVVLVLFLRNRRRASEGAVNFSREL